jgi:hypothetical protein
VKRHESVAPRPRAVYFGVGRNFSRSALSISIDYSLDDVPNTLLLNDPEPTPIDFLGRFRYQPVEGAQLEDMLANNMGAFSQGVLPRSYRNAGMLLASNYIRFLIP